MSKISIKTDFVDGDKLFSQQLNNNFLVIQAGINANEENLQEVIDQAIIELDAELEAITADRGWDWNGGNRVTFYKGNTEAVAAREIVNGQLLYNTDTGETALDDDGERIVTGSGNVIAIDDDEPTNPATKLWIDPDKIVNYPASYVVNSMSGSDIDKAPSVNAVKDYVGSMNDYSTTETVIGTYKIGTTARKPLYRKEYNFTNVDIGSETKSWETQLDLSNIDYIFLDESHSYWVSTDNGKWFPMTYVNPATSPETFTGYFLDLTNNVPTFKFRKTQHTNVWSIHIVVEYTKSTD